MNPQGSTTKRATGLNPRVGGLALGALRLKRAYRPLITTDELVELIDDACIDAGCSFDQMPQVLQVTYNAAKKEQDRRINNPRKTDTMISALVDAGIR